MDDDNDYCVLLCVCAYLAISHVYNEPNTAAVFSMSKLLVWSGLVLAEPKSVCAYIHADADCLFLSILKYLSA